MFVLAGSLLYAANLGIDALFEPAPDRITVSADTVSALAQSWQQRTGRVPSAAEIDALIAQHVDEEILIAEAARNGLHQSDPVVAQRLRQNLVFIGGASHVAGAPLLSQMVRRDPVARRRLVQLMRHRIESAATLDASRVSAWVQANPERFRLPPRFDLEQRFFSRDIRTGAGALQAARQALSDLHAGHEVMADPFLFGDRQSALSESELARRFGPQLAQAMVTAPQGEWQGPVESVYGAHVFRLLEVQAAPELDPADARRRALHGSYAELEREHFQAHMARLRQNYDVEILR